MSTSGLSVTVLGCAGSYAGAGEACSGYLVRSPSTTLWVDCGPGTLANLQDECELGDVDALLVSHHHPDHCAELPVVYNAAKYYLGVEQLPVLCPEGVRSVTEVFHPTGDSSDILAWRIVADGSQVTIGDIDITFSRTDHPIETLAMRFDHDGRSIVYTSDTGPAWSLASLGASPDIVVGEGTLVDATDRPGVPHVTCRHLAADANGVGAGRLVVTHVPPGSDPEVHRHEAAEVFDGPVDVARTGLRFAT
jgi:ribonuclease BN (tRNA processing enzyme)